MCQAFQFPFHADGRSKCALSAFHDTRAAGENQIERGGAPAAPLNAAAGAGARGRLFLVQCYAIVKKHMGVVRPPFTIARGAVLVQGCNP